MTSTQRQLTCLSIVVLVIMVFKLAWDTDSAKDRIKALESTVTELTRRLQMVHGGGGGFVDSHLELARMEGQSSESKSLAVDQEWESMLNPDLRRIVLLVSSNNIQFYQYSKSDSNSFSYRWTPNPDLFYKASRRIK